MWDSHFRVGGAEGSELDEPTCPKFGFNDQCIAASLMFHVTSQASGYFENVWAWVADHDNDMNMYDEFDPTANQVSIYGARGMLIESQGPSWFYGTGSEHSVLYNYQLNNAKNVSSKLPTNRQMRLISMPRFTWATSRRRLLITSRILWRHSLLMPRFRFPATHPS